MNIQFISRQIMCFAENFIHSLSAKDKKILLVASVVFGMIALNYLFKNRKDSKVPEASLFTGHGTLIFLNGDIMEGDFKDGKLNGKAKVTRKDGEIWEGEFKDNQLHGLGKITHADGMVKEGTFKHSVLVE